MKAVAELLGHSETRITERYAHLAPAAVASYVDVLDGKGQVGTGFVLPDWLRSSGTP